MTLVVARVTPLGVRLAGDMRITNPDAAGPPGFFGAELKVILLSPTLCVAYAGNVGAALNAIRQVASQALGVAEVESHLLSAHEQSQPATDFLVASLRPTRLVAIKEGRTQVCNACWVGDAEAFSEYQRIYHDAVNLDPPREFYDSSEEAEDMAIANRMGNGMQAVVFGRGYFTEGAKTRVQIPEGGDYEGVGEAVIAVVLRAEDNLFGYSTQNRAIGLGGAEAGGFFYSVLTPAEPGVGCVGIYFHEASLGLLYAPLELDEPERYAKGSQNEFAEQVRSKRGIELHGFGVA
jgi:hypothetical protein